MSTTSIKQDINERISLINLSFDTYSQKRFKGFIPMLHNNFKGILDNDLDRLELILKTIIKLFNRFNIATYVLSGLLIIALITKHNPTFDFLSSSTVGLTCVCIISYINTFNYYKFKANIENKIYLLKLLDSIDK